MTRLVCAPAPPDLLADAARPCLQCRRCIGIIRRQWAHGAHTTTMSSSHNMNSSHNMQKRDGVLPRLDATLQNCVNSCHLPDDAS